MSEKSRFNPNLSRNQKLGVFGGALLAVAAFAGYKELSGLDAKNREAVATALIGEEGQLDGYAFSVEDGASELVINCAETEGSLSTDTFSFTIVEAPTKDNDYKIMVKAVNAGAVTFDANGKVVRARDSETTLYSLTEEQLEGQDPSFREILDYGCGLVVEE